MGLPIRVRYVTYVRIRHRILASYVTIATVITTLLAMAVGGPAAGLEEYFKSSFEDKLLVYVTLILFYCIQS